jgi:hypothetical protein
MTRSNFVGCSRIAQPPKATFVTRLRPAQLPGQVARRQLPDQSTTLRVEPSSTSDSRLRGARPKSDIRGSGYREWRRPDRLGRLHLGLNLSAQKSLTDPRAASSLPSLSFRGNERASLVTAPGRSRCLLFDKSQCTIGFIPKYLQNYISIFFDRRELRHARVATGV